MMDTLKEVGKLMNSLDLYTLWRPFERWIRIKITNKSSKSVYIIIYSLGVFITFILYPIFTTYLDYKQVYNGYDAYITNMVSFNGIIRIIDRDRKHSIKFSGQSHNNIVGDHDYITLNDSMMKLIIKPIDWWKLFINSQRDVILSVDENRKSLELTMGSLEGFKISTTDVKIIQPSRESTVKKKIKDMQQNDRFTSINSINRKGLQDISNKQDLQNKRNNNNTIKVKVTILAMPEKFLRLLKDYGALMFFLLIAFAIRPIFLNQ